MVPSILEVNQMKSYHQMRPSNDKIPAGLLVSEGRRAGARGMYESFFRDLMVRALQLSTL
jgi:hypothetical protein